MDWLHIGTHVDHPERIVPGNVMPLDHLDQHGQPRLSDMSSDSSTKSIDQGSPDAIDPGREAAVHELV
ncbi:hypothetical protein LTR17_010307 [Elasticomyces elasticus]|nr:hypothetical protein LTR17_010307 [Elasticomyces elasticus]